MTAEEILLRRLAGQHLLLPSDTQTVVKDLCGVQAQFLSHALHGLSIRCHSVSTEGLIKSWTNRGTMHLLSADDLPLFLHQDRSHFLRPVYTLGGDAFITASRKEYFAELILEAMACGIDQRESLKALCRQAGMTETVLDGKAYFYIKESLPIGHPPKLLFLAGFDQFLLGYDKTESLTLPKEHLRDIFTLSGMVRPAIWMDGRIVGWWNLKNRRLSLKLFEEENHSVTEAVHHQWPDLKSIAIL